MLKPVILLNKPLGLTPLQAIMQFKKLHREYAEATISYAGRLDPMAEGLLLLLVSEENKKRKQYEDLEKTYEFSLLLGIATDTYDLLGKITDISTEQPASSIEKIEELLPSFLGEQTLPYPPYSSRTVQGKPLYWYARNNKLHKIELPLRRVHISSFEFLSSTLLPTPSLLPHVFGIIGEIQGDFRQRDIITLWHDSSPRFPTHFPLLSFRLVCSSGTYVRQIVHEMGKMVGIPTVTYTIKRTRIGVYDLKDAFRIESR